MKQKTGKASIEIISYYFVNCQEMQTQFYLLIFFIHPPVKIKAASTTRLSHYSVFATSFLSNSNRMEPPMLSEAGINRPILYCVT